MPPINAESQARIELLVGIDKSSYNQSKQQLRALFREKGELGLSTGDLQNFADQIRGAIQTGKSAINSTLNEQIDLAMGDYLSSFAEIRKGLNAAWENGDEMAVLHFKDAERELNAKIASELESHRKRVEEEQRLNEDAHQKRLEAADALKKATEPNLENFKKSGSAFGGSVLDIFDKAKSGDIRGLVEGISGALQQGLERKKELTELESQASEDPAAAEAMAAMAARLGAVASALAVIGGAVAGALALFALLDDQAKDLNKTLMEGASIADFSFKKQQNLVANMTTSLDAARAAAFDVADEMRGTGEEMAGILAQLNQAGLSFREMADGTRTVQEETRRYADAIRNTYKWSTALGVTVGEVAETSAAWSTQFGMDLAQINEQFAVIGKFADVGGFNVKRFFTAVSQATSGMALYNIRIDEAAQLLSKTQTILGETDASDFIQSLTKGFTDESTTDRMKRIMIAGGKDTERIFDGVAERTARGFVKTFQGSGTQKAIEKAFQGTGLEATLFGPDGAAQLERKWADLSEHDRRMIIGQLRANGDEQSQAAARQLTTLGQVVDGTSGGLEAQTRGLAALDMQGKLALKLQTLGDKRLSDMSIEERAAFENYAGISGAQLEQLERVEDQLLSDYEVYKEGEEQAGRMAKTWESWLATNDAAADSLASIEDLEAQSDYYMRKSVENTRSVFNILKNTIASILNDIYTLLTSWRGDDLGLSDASMGKQQDAVTELRAQREESTKRLEELDVQLGELDKTIHTTRTESDEHATALAEQARLTSEQNRLLAAKDYLRAQERQVLLLDENALSNIGDVTGVKAAASRSLSESGEDIEIASRHLSPDIVKELEQLKFIGGSRVGGVFDPSTVVMDELLNASAESDELLAAGNDAFLQYSTAGGQGIAQIADSERKILSDFTNNWQADSTQAIVDANRRMDAEEGALGLGYTAGTAEYEQAVSDFMAGNFNPYAKQIGDAGMGGSFQDMFGYSGGVAPDFVMRPGQPAQRFNPSDTVVGLKAGGPLASGGAAGNVYITINGGDQAATYQIVKSAIKNSGLRP